MHAAPSGPGGAYGAVHRSSPGSCRSRVWYSAIGSRNTLTVPSATAAATQRAQHRRRVGRVRRRGDHEARDVAEHGDAVVVVEVAAEPLLVAVAGDAHDERVGVLPVGEERQAGRLAAQLILGVVQVGEVLDLGDRHQPGHARPERQPEDRLLVEQRVEHPPPPGLALQAAGDAVHPALGPDVLAEHEHTTVAGEQVAERAVDRLGERERPLVLGQAAEEGGPAPRVRPRRTHWSATATGRRGDSGAITSAAVRQRRGLPISSVGRGPHRRPPIEVAGDDARAATLQPCSTSTRAVASSGSRLVVGADRRRRCGRRPRRRCRRGPPKRTVRRWSTAGRPDARTHSASSSATSNTPTGSVPSARS